jgi:hypothetical protein
MMRRLPAALSECTDAFTSFMRHYTSFLFMHQFYQTPA